jgi:hypothetical protein
MDKFREENERKLEIKLQSSNKLLEITQKHPEKEEKKINYLFLD